jgi:AcrR family transcriptional regulator
MARSARVLPARAARRRVRARRLAPEVRADGIVDAARELFCARGYDETAVAAIAARLGVAEGTVFKYFPTKRALLLAVLERWYEEMFGDYARELAGIAGPRARLRHLVWRHLRAVRDNSELCRLMFREVRAAADYPGSRLHAMNRRYTQLLLEVVQDGVQARAFRGDIPPALLRDLVYGGIEHHAWGFLSGRGRLDPDDLAERITALIVEGLARRNR